MLTKGTTNQIVGWKQKGNSPGSLVYFLSEVSDDIYKLIDFPTRVQSIHIGYDNNLWLLAIVSTTTWGFYKMDPASGNYQLVFEFQQPAPPNPAYYGYTYNDFIFVGGDAYLSGSWRLARIQNLAPPVSGSYLSNYDKLNGKLNFRICN
jgi:hypothetical protein